MKKKYNTPKEGDIYGRLTVVKEYEKRNGETYFLCKCICGNTKVAPKRSLQRGFCLSCGCLHKERTIASSKQRIKNNIYEQIDKDTIKVWAQDGLFFITSTEFLPYVKEQCWAINKSSGYAYCRMRGVNKKQYFHRYVFKDKDIEGMVIDHINGKVYDNRADNLRIVTHSKNTMNTTVEAGVSYSKNIQKWWAYIDRNKKRINLGYYATREEAVSARRKAEDLYPTDYIRRKKCRT